jgi:hypothetical protein
MSKTSKKNNEIIKSKLTMIETIGVIINSEKHEERDNIKLVDFSNSAASAYLSSSRSFRFLLGLLACPLYSCIQRQRAFR